MKTLFLVLILIGFNFTLFGQTGTVKHLPVELQNSGIFHVAAVRTVDTATYVDVHVTFIPGWRTRFFTTSFIKDTDSDLKWFPKGIAGAEFGKDIRTPKSGDTLVTLIFDPLPNKVKRIDFGQDEEMFVYGAEISGKQSKKHTKLSAKKEKEVFRWLQKELAKAKNLEILKSYDGEDFFRRDSVRIVGYMKGYDKRLGFASGIVYASNELTRESYPATVRIYEDGRFEAAYATHYPQILYIAIENKVTEFYAEPGHTLGVLLDWEDFLQHDRYRDRSYIAKYTQYLGDLASFNRDFFAVKINKPDYNQLSDKQKKIAPDDFKKMLVSEWKSESVRVDSLLAQKNVDAKLSSLIKAEMDLTYASYIFDYTMSRDHYSKQDTTNAILKMLIPEDYYDFVCSLDLNNQTYIATSKFSTFINRFEYSPIYQSTDPYNNQINDRFAFVDSIAMQNFSEIPLMVHIAKSRSVKGRIEYVRDTSRLEVVVGQAIQTIPLDFLKTEVFRLKAEKLRNDAGYELPDTYAAELFRKIIAEHQGKVLIIDFWAEWCGPCRAGIESTLADRERFSGDPYVDFVFITDEKSTGKAFYDEYVQTNKMTNSYRVTADEYLALRELFGFNGIPRYVLVDPDGKIKNKDFSMHNWKYELPRKYPDLFSEAYFR